ncbi:hypothetical protein K491DRAFT_331434 [Lophiostoma macrostomum CBS 122681]|uniref:MARVEL domain-containing protein n=1 Tax=Lophiostoma macrostomum CBS 122681 TaxID=1314788 RepID=A0A6A6TFF8_9PLEO|nr:hypothetical protein K491DRAFT_331434 [Lophiostoma macrostomum CBS 122681]
MANFKGGAVPIPRWILGIRALQLFFAILVLALTAYALSVFSGGPVCYSFQPRDCPTKTHQLQPPLIATIIIAVLTLVPILLLTTPLHLMQRRIYDPRIALVLDGFALLYWLAAFTAMACYHDIFHYYGSSYAVFAVNSDVVQCRSCRRAWKAGVAATVFSAIEL